MADEFDILLARANSYLLTILEVIDNFDDLHHTVRVAQLLQEVSQRNPRNFDTDLQYAASFDYTPWPVELLSEFHNLVDTLYQLSRLVYNHN